MKTLTADALTVIAAQYATEPLNIVEIEWNPGSVSLYADKVVDGIPGKILTLSAVEIGLTVDNLQAGQVTVTLDDTDGSIKAILDTIDIHKKKATIYQFYGELTQDDRFAIIVGKISTPFSWAEHDRQITFTITTEVENYEVGFSPEEGQLEFVAPEHIGKPWPLVFGNVVHVPAQKVTQAKECTLLETIGIVDPTLQWKLNRILETYNYAAFMLRLSMLVMQGADAIAPSAQTVINNLIHTLQMKLAQISVLNGIRTQLFTAQQLHEADPGNVAFENDVTTLEQQLEAQSYILDGIQRHIESVTYQAELVRFEYAVKKSSANDQIFFYNHIRKAYADYIETQQEICRQEEYCRTVVQVHDPQELFEENIPTDVLVNNVRFRVQFANSQMTIQAGPLPTYSNLIVDPWVQDDEPCSGMSNVDGANLFWLNADPAPNIEGMWLVVKDMNESIHLIQVEKQENQKVYFRPVRWDWSNNTGQPRGIDLDTITRDVVDVPYAISPLGTPVPADIFTGNLDPAIWSRPESEEFLAYLSLLPGYYVDSDGRYVSPIRIEELQTLAMLVFLKPLDGLANALYLVEPRVRDVFTVIGDEIREVIAASPLVLPSWIETYNFFYEELPDKLTWTASPGSSIRDTVMPCDVYIANILPSTIKAVHAYKTNDEGRRYLAPVPSHYYIKNETAALGTITVTALTFPRPLMSISGEGWEDTVYVTISSSVGPNVVDVIEHLITTYTDKTVDATNFASIHAKMVNYPANFALFDRPNVLDELARIAWESRLAIVLKNDVFTLKYLAETPVSDATITAAEIENQTLSIEYTRTEELVTVLESIYHKTYLPLEDNEKELKIVLRHNLKKYGLHKRQEYFHIYNDPTLVEKSATFWLIRYSNTWKRVSLATFHSMVRLEALDTVTLDYTDTPVANADVKSIVESVSYDSDTNSINLALLVPVRAGEMTEYPYFWPASVEEELEYPSAADIAEGYAGGYGPGSGVTGAINDCPTS